MVRTASSRVRALIILTCAIATFGGSVAFAATDAPTPSLFARIVTRVVGWVQTVIARGRASLVVQPRHRGRLIEGFRIAPRTTPIPEWVPAGERAAIERAERILGGIPVDPRKPYDPTVGPLGQPIPDLNRPQEETRAMDAALEEAIRRANELRRQRAAQQEGSR